MGRSRGSGSADIPVPAARLPLALLLGNAFRGVSSDRRVPRPRRRMADLRDRRGAGTAGRPGRDGQQPATHRRPRPHHHRRGQARLPARAGPPGRRPFNPAATPIGNTARNGSFRPRHHPRERQPAPAPRSCRGPGSRRAAVRPRRPLRYISPGCRIHGGATSGVGVTVLARRPGDADLEDFPGPDVPTMPANVERYGRACDEIDVRHVFDGQEGSLLRRESPSAALLVLTTPGRRFRRAPSRSALGHLLAMTLAPITFVRADPGL